MSTRDWNIVYLIAIVVFFVFGGVGLYPFFAGDTEAARERPLGNLWSNLALVSVAFAVLADYKTHYARVPGGALAYIIWLVIVIGAGIALRPLIMHVLRSNNW